jgi:Kef-type K+ transport system membrane component KefB
MLSVTPMQTQVIYPALNKMGMWSEAAGELVLGTAIVESTLTYLK